MAYIGSFPADKTSGAKPRDEFTGDGSTVNFTLSQEVPGGFESNVLVIVDNVLQQPVESYTIGGDNLTLQFSEAPASGAVIYVLHQGNATYQMIPVVGSVTPDKLSENLRNFTVDTFTGNGSTVDYTLSDTPASANSILVIVDGIFQTKTTNYTLSGTTLTFTGAPDSGAAITVIHLGFSTVSRTAVPDGSITTAKIADNAITSAKLGFDVIVAEDIAANAITVSELQNGAVTAAKLASGAVVSHLGYTPANKAGDTITGDIDINKTTARLRLTDGSKSMAIGQWDTTNNRLESFGAPLLVAQYGSNDVTFQNASSGGYFKMDSVGRVIKPYQPAFDAYRTGNVTSTVDTFVQVQYNNTALNVGGSFNTTNGVFTAPVAGMYQFNVNFFGSKPTSTARIDLAFYINGSNVRGVEFQGMRTDVSINTGFEWSQAIYLNANDTIAVYTRCFTNNGLIYGDGYFNRFSGYLVA